MSEFNKEFNKPNLCTPEEMNAIIDEFLPIMPKKKFDFAASIRNKYDITNHNKIHNNSIRISEHFTNELKLAEQIPITGISGNIIIQLNDAGIKCQEIGSYAKYKDYLLEEATKENEKDDLTIKLLRNQVNVTDFQKKFGNRIVIATGCIILANLGIATITYFAPPKKPTEITIQIDSTTLRLLNTGMQSIKEGHSQIDSLPKDITYPDTKPSKDLIDSPTVKKKDSVSKAKVR